MSTFTGGLDIVWQPIVFAQTTRVLCTRVSGTRVLCTRVSGTRVSTADLSGTVSGTLLSDSFLSESLLRRSRVLQKFALFSSVCNHVRVSGYDSLIKTSCISKNIKKQ